MVGSHEQLSDFYRSNFILVHDYHYSLTELEDMIPWERDIFLGLIANRVQEIKNKNK